MKCLTCSKNQFIKKKIFFTTRLQQKDEPVEVLSEAFVCINCATPLVDTEQMNALRRAVGDKYKENNRKIIHTKGPDSLT